MKAGRTTHKKIAATVARFNRQAEPQKKQVVRDADYYRTALARPFLSPRDRRHYQRELEKCEARARALAALASEARP